MTIFRASVATIALTVLVPIGAAAQSTTTLPLTIEDAIGRAITHAPRLAEARAREAAARAMATGRAALARPSVVASSGVVRTNHVDEFGVPQSDGSFRVIFPDIPTNYRARAELVAPLYTAGRIGALTSSADADRRAASAELRGVEADVALDVAVAYWTLVTARERVAVLTRSRDRSDASLADVGARVDTGILPPNDRLSAQAQRARQHVQVLQAEQDAALAEAQLARLVGAPPGTPVVTVTTVNRVTPGAAELAAITPADLAVRAATARPERLALTERRAALGATAEAAMAATRPQVSALAAVEPARPNPRFVPRTDTWNLAWDVGVQVNWSIWDGGRSRAERVAVAAQADAVSARIEEFDAAIALELRQQLLEIATARAAIAAVSEAVSAASEARRVVGERFLAGVAAPTDVLDAEVAQLEAELERTRWQSALRMGEARLIRSVGRP